MWSVRKGRNLKRMETRVNMAALEVIWGFLSYVKLESREQMRGRRTLPALESVSPLVISVRAKCPHAK